MKTKATTARQSTPERNSLRPEASGKCNGLGKYWMPDDRALAPPFVELSFAVPNGAMAGVTETLVGRALLSKTTDGMPTNMEAPDIIGISRGIEVIAIRESTLSILGEAEPDGEWFTSDASWELREPVVPTFRDVAAKIDFLYGAILVEEPLESLGQLIAQDGGSYAFRNFALSNKHFNDEAVSAILAIVPKAKVERHDWGVMVVMIKNMMPAGEPTAGLSPNEAQERSLEISKLIADALST